MSATLYIAGPMSGYPEFNYPAFNGAALALSAKGYRPLNPASNDVPVGSAWETYMRTALTMMLAAHGVAVLPGWECSRGARIEVDLACALGMPVRPLSQWLVTT